MSGRERPVSRIPESERQSTFYNTIIFSPAKLGFSVDPNGPSLYFIEDKGGSAKRIGWC